MVRSDYSGAKDEQALQVLPFGKLERHRMVGGGAEALDDLRVAARIERSAGDDRLEQLGRDAAGARKGGEQAAGREELERPEVDVLVGARRLLDLGGGRGELRRVEHD